MARSSQSRRRRLIQRGLLGVTVADVDPVEDTVDIDDDMVDMDVDDQFVTELAIEQATAAVLATETSYWSETTCEIAPTLAPEIETEATSQQLKSLPPVLAQSHAGLAAVQALIRRTQDITWVFTGDNIVQGAFYTQGARSCIEIFTERVRAEMRRAGDVVINTGVAGDTASQLLRTLKRRALRYRPEVVGLSIGINDSKLGLDGREPFRRDVREILDRIRTAGSIPLLILPHPIYVPSVGNRTDLPYYVEILQELAVRDEVPCVDQWNDWLENWPSPEETRARLTDGRIQLNAVAHRHLASLIFCTLGIYDPTSSACGG